MMGYAQTPDDRRCGPATPAVGFGLTRKILDHLFVGTFFGVAAPCVFALCRTAIELARMAGGGADLSGEASLRFLLVVAVAAAAPSIPAWAAAGALTGFVYALAPDQVLARHWTQATAGIAAGVFAGILCGLIWHEGAPLLIVGPLGAVMGLATTTTLSRRHSPCTPGVRGAEN